MTYVRPKISGTHQIIKLIIISIDNQQGYKFFVKIECKILAIDYN